MESKRLKKTKRSSKATRFIPKAAISVLLMVVVLLGIPAAAPYNFSLLMRPVEASSTQVIGNSNYVGSGAAGYLWFFVITPSVNMIVTNVGQNVQTSGGTFMAAIYDSSGAGGAPKNLLGATSSVTLSNGWNDPALSSQVTLTGGTKYYLAEQFSSSAAAVYYYEGSGDANYLIGSFSYQNFPATVSNPSSYTVGTFNMRITYTSTATSSTSSQTAGTHTVLYSTDFESATSVGTYGMSLGNDVNGVAVNAEFVIDSSGADAWVEGVNRHTPGITCHTGSRCIGIETGAGGVNTGRFEFNIMDLQNNLAGGGDLTGKEMYVSDWILFPANFEFPNWLAFIVPYQSEVANPNEGGYYTPGVEWQIWNGTSYMDTVAKFGTASTSSYLNQIVGYYPAPGQWHHVQYYVYFGYSNGWVEGWVDSTLIVDSTNIETIGYSGQPMLTTIAKDYHDPSTALYQMWLDDFELDSVVPSSSSTTTSTSATSSSSSVGITTAGGIPPPSNTTSSSQTATSPSSTSTQSIGSSTTVSQTSSLTTTTVSQTSSTASSTTLSTSSTTTVQTASTAPSTTQTSSSTSSSATTATQSSSSTTTQTSSTAATTGSSGAQSAVTSLTATVSPSSPQVNSPVTFTLTLHGSWKNLTGVVVNKQVSVSAWGSGGKCQTGQDGTCQVTLTTPTSAGSYSVTVQFNGDSNFQASSTSIPLTVSTTSYSIAATVSVRAGGKGATVTVYILQGGTVIGSQTYTVSGSHTFTFTGLAAGTYTITVQVNTTQQQSKTVTLPPSAQVTFNF